MFERFTDRARRVVVLAQEGARMRNHSYIGSEHLLYALAAENEGIAAKSLNAFSVTGPIVMDEIGNLVSDGENPPSGHVPFTQQTKKSLEYALREALSLGHNYIGTEHLLLGLIRLCSENSNVSAAKIFDTRGVDPNALKEHVLELAPTYESPRKAAAEKGEVAYGDTPGTITSQVIVECLTALNRLDVRERNAVFAYLESWYNDQ